MATLGGLGQPRFGGPFSHRGDWFKATNFFMHTTVAQAIEEPVTLGDTQFFLLPFLASRRYVITLVTRRSGI